MKELAIMIPVRNNKEYLKIALSSLEEQTSDNFEVVLIDDGSTDDIKSICNNYNFIINYIRNDDCRGVGHARNIGLSYIINNNYKYMMFLDSDDRLKPNAVEVAVQKIENNDVDWLQFFAELSDSDTLSCNIPSHTLWNGIYKVDTINKLHITFSDIPSHEDLYFIMLLKLNNVSHVLIQDVLYEHKLNTASIVHTSKLLEYNYINCVRLLCNFIENYNGVFKLTSNMASELAELIIFCYPCHQACKLQGTEDENLIENIKNILTFADKYGILNYTVFNVPSQAFVGNNRSFYEEPTGLYIFRQSFDKWLQKYGYTFKSIRVYR